MDPQQELFSRLLMTLREKGYDVYDGYLPPEDTPYPFIYLGNSRQLDRQLKNAVVGTVYQTIHVWHNDMRKRGELSLIMLDAKRICYELTHTENFDWNVQDMEQEILTDNTTKHPLFHGIVDVEFLFS